MRRSRPEAGFLRLARGLSRSLVPALSAVAVWAAAMTVAAGAGAAATGASSAAAPARVPGARPNIVFLLADDLRFDTIRALGNREIQTPNLDQLVRRGTTFTRAAIMGGTQGAVCVPSRAMLFTGRTLFHATRTPTGLELAEGAVTWPEALRQNGYATVGIGKWHNDRAAFARAFNAGGPIFFGGMSGHQAMPVQDFDPSGAYPKSRERVATNFSSEVFADAAIRFLAGRQQAGQPYALYVAFTSPHDPRTPPAEVLASYHPDRLRLPASFLPEHPFDNGELRIRDEALLPWPRTPTAIRREIALYYAMITHLDAQIGRILKALEQTPDADNTVIVFAGDNGLAVGRHGLLGKQNLYEHSVRVPLVFAGPGIPRNRRSDALCYLLDVMPTLCDLAGVAIPPTAEGLSLGPVIRRETKAIRTELFGAYRLGQRSLQDGRWKLIEYPGVHKTQLFDLRRDPDELHDLAEVPRHRPTVERLRARLRAAQNALDDPLLAPGKPGASLIEPPSVTSPETKSGAARPDR